jgi:hypothetical protein
MNALAPMNGPIAGSAAPSPSPVDPGRERGVQTAEITGLDFWDLVDLINPLQHIPVVSTLYRALTGDKMKPVINVLGGALYGGPVGLLTAFASSAVEQTTGREPLIELAAMVRGEGDTPPPAATPHDASPQDEAMQLASGPPVSLLPPVRPAAPAVVGIATPLTPPPWLGVALNEAKTAPKAGTQPAWLTDAITGGLDKYAAMARDRRAAQSH